ncbi:deubiquitinase DESI2-like [Dioscorea cayenensis subsp. rotundata]|uniref:Deubiquitinase DESI2-like n=1 Tax=Dioscorea cayennensis subsp. rotundata TaxID=55577 RepID=A0AB40C5X3_DIOCR|nr:deubiquitinase DESI2-like [Dioscorea cayenensis subsp. rotundata]
MKEVVLHIYDVTNSGSDKANNTILQINRFFKDGIGLGGIFHSAVQVYGDEEWSFGFCEHGSGVFSCPPRKNHLYTYRESMVLGETNLSCAKVNQILRELSREWPGSSYGLLSRNCNHFCDTFCDRLGTPKLPAWVNRFANAGDTALEVAENTAIRFRQAKTEIISASKAAYSFISGIVSNTPATPENLSDEETEVSLCQGSCFKNLISISSKPSTSNSEQPEDSNNHIPQQQQQEHTEKNQPSS